MVSIHSDMRFPCLHGILWFSYSVDSNLAEAGDQGFLPPEVELGSSLGHRVYNVGVRF